jgi:hypothetical protein
MDSDVFSVERKSWLSLALLQSGLFVSNADAIAQNFSSWWNASQWKIYSWKLGRARSDISGWDLVVAILGLLWSVACLPWMHGMELRLQVTR